MRFLSILLVTVFFILSPLCFSKISDADNKSDPLFPQDLPQHEWIKFNASGFSEPVSGIIYRKDNPPACGVALGGLGTGCLDLETRGVWGYESIFFPQRAFRPLMGIDMLRNAQLLLPFLGISVKGRTWVLTTQEFIDGGDILGAIDPVVYGKYMENTEYVKGHVAKVPKIEDVSAVDDISYWGHFPVADLEYHMDCPVKVSLRAWSPFVLGNEADSSIPAAVFEVRLRNTSPQSQKGTVAFSFPGPDEKEAESNHFTRDLVQHEFSGLHIQSLSKKVNYVLGLIGKKNVRLGDALSTSSQAWGKIAAELPHAPVVSFSGQSVSTSSGSSVAYDFELAKGASEVVRFVLAWYCPYYQGGSYQDVQGFDGDPSWRWLDVDKYPLPGRKNKMGEFYKPFYTGRFADAIAVANKISIEHERLLQRTLAWQNVIYNSEELPVWLQDCLINHLYTFAEDSLWAVPQKPLDDWAFPMGSFAMTEAPRCCAITGCIGTDWYGDFPIAYFFPELAKSILKMYAAYQRPDGAMPFLFASRDVTKPSYEWQIGFNGIVFSLLVNQLWMATNDYEILREFYPCVKKSVIFTMNLKPTPEGVISVHREGPGQSFWEHTPIYGMVTHLAGMRLAYLRVVESMAKDVGDVDFAERCRQWFDQGKTAMEKHLWSEEKQTYKLFYDKETGKSSEKILSPQFGGDFACFINGVEPVFQKGRVDRTLETIKTYCLTDYGMVGMVDIDTPDGKPEIDPYGTFAVEIRLVGMTYMYHGQKKFGLEIIRRLSDNMVRKHGMAWDLYCVLLSKDGGRNMGTDYFQNLNIWAVPGAMDGLDMQGVMKKNGLVDRILRATAAEYPARGVWE